MERKVTKLENCHVEVIVAVDNKTWKDAQEKAYDKLAKNVTIDGFRKGKAPTAMVRSKIDPMKAIDEAINSLLPELYREAVVEEKLQPFAQPKVEITKVSDTELEVKFIVTVAPSVELGKYTGYNVGKKEVEVSEEELNAALTELRSQNASLVLKEAEAALGDTVVMDFEGFINDEAFEGGKGENHELELGSHSFIPGFEEQLIGHKAGDEFEIKVTFPENYVESLKGKDASFKIKLHEVKQKQLPELDEELIKELNIAGVATLEQLRQYKKAEIARSKEVEAKREFFDKLTEEIAKDSKIEIPEEIIDDQVEHVFQDMVNRMQQSGLTLEQYLQIMGQTEEQLRAKLRVDAQKEANTYFILKAVGAKEEVEITPEEVDFELAKLADQYKMSLDDIKKALERQMDEFKNNLYMKRVEDFLYENNN